MLVRVGNNYAAAVASDTRLEPATGISTSRLLLVLRCVRFIEPARANRPPQRQCRFGRIIIVSDSPSIRCVDRTDWVFLQVRVVGLTSDAWVQALSTMSTRSLYTHVTPVNYHLAKDLLDLLQMP